MSGSLINFCEVQDMAKMIPANIDQENANLDGERLVFEMLSSQKLPGVAMHSLLQKNHRRKMIGEVDFLHISHRGILCIEVKGGKVYRKDGLWYSKGKNDKVNDIKDPFRQAKDCMYALKTYLEDVYGKRSQETNIIIGYAVVLPECIFTGSGNDLMTEILFDCRCNLDSFPDYIEKTFDFWAEQEKEKHNFTPKQLTKDQISKYTELFRGDFQVVPSMNLEIQYVEKKMLELTEEQFDALDVTLSNKRVIIMGVAGTGKSLLAIEKARKLMAANKKTAYICFNRNMAQYAKRSFREIPKGSYVGTYHSLLMQLDEYTTKLCYYSIEELSQKFLSDCDGKLSFECLIIDEAQDLLSDFAIEVFDKILARGLEKGEWVMFLDPNQNIFNRTKEYDQALDYLKEVYSPAIFHLTTNCRNTEQIGRRTSAVTLVPTAKHLKITGPKVIMKTYSSKNEFFSIFKREVQSLLSGGTAAKDIVILSKYKLENSILAGKSAICNLPVIEPNDITQFQNRSLNYFTIQSFKGLESNVVFLLDVDGFEDTQNRIANYVGMSRCKILLYFFVPKDKENDYIEITSKDPIELI